MPDHTISLYDSHSHFFTNDFASYPINIAGALEGEDALRKRIEDNPSTDETILALWDQCGITAGCAVQYNQVYKTDNAYTIAVSDAHPERITAVLLVPAAKEESPGWLRDTATRHNVGGIRLFGFPDGDEFPWLDSVEALRTWDVAAELGLPVDMMFVPGKVAPVALPRIMKLAQRYSDTSIVLDHCGWPVETDDPQAAFTEHHRALGEQPNIHVKYTQVNPRQFVPKGMDMAAFMREVVDIFGANRVMWGSDYGNTKVTYPQMVEQAIAACANLSDDERSAVLHDTGRRVFGSAPARR